MVAWSSMTGSARRDAQMAQMARLARNQNSDCRNKLPIPKFERAVVKGAVCSTTTVRTAESVPKIGIARMSRARPLREDAMQLASFCIESKLSDDSESLPNNSEINVALGNTKTLAIVSCVTAK